jgi:hypothetical protein
MSSIASPPAVNPSLATRVHRRSRQCILLLSLGLQFLILQFLILRLSAQDDVVAQFANYPFRLRLEHTREDSNVCVLLRRDGQFHLEHTRADETLVWEGRLSESDLAQLNLALDSDQLQQLSQQQIIPPLLYSGNDQLQLNVFRRDHWQTLRFPDATTQAAYRAAIRPLLSWLTELHNQPHRELSEDAGKNNCLTPERLQLKIRNAPPPASATGKPSEEPGAAAGVADPHPQQPPSFLLRYSRDRFSNSTLVRTCVILGPAGGYQMERGSQQISFKMKASVFAGSVSDGELRELRQMLDEPRLKNERHQNRLPDMAVRDAEVISVSVPREGEIQELVFSDYSGSLFGLQGSAANSTADTGAIEPLRRWLKTAIENKKLAPLKSAQPNNCAGTP